MCFHSQNPSPCTEYDEITSIQVTQLDVIPFNVGEGHQAIVILGVGQSAHRKC